MDFPDSYLPKLPPNAKIACKKIHIFPISSRLGCKGTKQGPWYVIFQWNPNNAHWILTIDIQVQGDSCFVFPSLEEILVRKCTENERRAACTNYTMSLSVLNAMSVGEGDIGNVEAPLILYSYIRSFSHWLQKNLIYPKFVPMMEKQNGSCNTS